VLVATYRLNRPAAAPKKILTFAASRSIFLPFSADLIHSLRALNKSG
jgi:hypothetical protein